MDAAGDLYGATDAGGINGLGNAWQLTPSGSYTDLHDFGGTLPNGNLDGVNPIGGVVVDATGNLYGTAQQGGAFNSGCAWKLTPSGTYSDLWDFGNTLPNGNPDGGYPFGPIALDAAGNLYGT